jgi:3-oxoacyl-[acyl-carrier protein] reductase
MNIIITGASRGIGAALARVFSIKGNHQIFILSRNKEKLNRLVVNCIDLNPNIKVIPFKVDISDSGNLKECVNQILLITQKVDILINNAGLAIRKPFDEFTPEEVERLMNINFRAPANLISLLMPALLKAGNSHVVNISSMGGFQGSRKYPGLSFYSASKAALAVLTEALSEEYKGRGVSFNCLALGAVQTEMFSEVFPGHNAQVGPDEAATFIADFALHAHNFLNGKIIPVSLSEP